MSKTNFEKKDVQFHNVCDFYYTAIVRVFACALLLWHLISISI